MHKNIRHHTRWHLVAAEFFSFLCLCFNFKHSPHFSFNDNCSVTGVDYHNKSIACWVTVSSFSSRDFWNKLFNYDSLFVHWLTFKDNCSVTLRLISITRALFAETQSRLLLHVTAGIDCFTTTLQIKNRTSSKPLLIQLHSPIMLHH